MIQLILTFLQPGLHQHIFEFDFQVDTLGASISKSTSDGGETLLGDVVFERFALSFVLAKYDMKVKVHLRFVVS